MSKELILLTGVSRGLGYNTAKLLCENSYNVVGLSRKKSKELEILIENCPEKFKYIKFDLLNINKIRDLYLNILKPLGNYKSFVSNAAYAYDDIITNAKVKNIDYMYKVNVEAPIFLSKYMIRDMLLNDIKGSLVFISSVSAHTGYKGLSMYASSKGAIEALSRSIAREWGGRGIRSNVVSPGFMETDMSSGLSEQQKQRIYKRTSLKRKTSIISVANTVEYLISDKALSITGETIRVDNGTI